jgi:hypothetical protein
MGKLKTIGKGIGKTAKWAVPTTANVEKQVKDALSDKEVSEAYSSYEGDSDKFVTDLKGYIERENYKNSRLKHLSDVMDVTNKALMPVDATLAAFNIFAGVGTAAEGVITLGKLPGYLAYDAYYFGKTHDLKGTAENIVWEATAWLVPGSLPHLINHYSQQADRYAVKKGIEEFLKKIKQKDNVISLDDYRKNKNLESISEAA